MMVNDQLVVTTHTMFYVTDNKTGEQVIGTTNEAQAKIFDTKINGEWYPAWRLYIDDELDNGAIDVFIRKVWLCDVNGVTFETVYEAVGDAESLAYADQIDDEDFMYFKEKSLMNKVIMNKLEGKNESV